MPEKIQLYTDGGCRNTGNTRGNAVKPTDKAAWATRLIFGDHIKDLTAGEYGQTNNYMELTAVIQGLAAIKKPTYPVEVFADSAYVINAMQKRWWVKWQRQNWVDDQGAPRKNAALWQQLLTQVDRFDKITWVKVKGHATNPNNIAVDALLNQTMDAMAKR